MYVGLMIEGGRICELKKHAVVQKCASRKGRSDKALHVAMDLERKETEVAGR